MMQNRRYGNLGFEVSALGFGAMRLPHLEDGTCDYDRAVPMLQRGIELGITYIDSAYVYINGTSEVAVGKAIKYTDREKLTIALLGSLNHSVATVGRVVVEARPATTAPQ